MGNKIKIEESVLEDILKRIETLEKDNDSHACRLDDLECHDPGDFDDRISELESQVSSLESDMFDKVDSYYVDDRIDDRIGDLDSRITDLEDNQ